jgi:Tfp pilus assembly protein PilO
VLTLLFFLILYTPARAEYCPLPEAIDRLRSEIQARHREASRLEQISGQLETSQQDRQQLLTVHFVQREVAFSEIPNELERLAQGAGVRKSVVNYDMAPVPEYGLYSLGIRIPVDGGYDNIVNFIKSLETSDIFFIIDSIDVRTNSANVSAGSNSIALSLSLETFLYQ